MLSVTIITKNEEKNIKNCLASVQWADEIVVVDSGSCDNTLDICESFGCRIIKTKWLGFGPTKKLAVDSAKNDWILSIDADEVVSIELKNKISFLLKNPLYYGYKIRRCSYYLNKPIYYSGWQADYPLRLFNRQYGNFNCANIHESVSISEKKIIKIKETLFHYPFPSLQSHINKINKYSQLEAEKLFYQNKKPSLIQALFKGGFKFFRMYFLRKVFLDGKEGFILALMSSYSSVIKYLKLWDMYRIKNLKN